MNTSKPAKHNFASMGMRIFAMLVFVVGGTWSSAPSKLPGRFQAQ